MEDAGAEEGTAEDGDARTRRDGPAPVVLTTNAGAATAHHDGWAAPERRGGFGTARPLRDDKDDFVTLGTVS